MRNETVILDDNKIVDMFLDRDDSAISEVMKKYGKLIFSISRNIVGNTQDAEECVNDTYLSIWSTIPPNKPYDRFKGYLCKTAINISNNKRRKIIRHNIVQFEDNMDLFVSSMTANEQEQVQNKIDIINAFLENLPKEDRLIFVKKYSLEYTDAQIAKEQNLNVYTVKNRLRKMRKDIKKQIKKEENNE